MKILVKILARLNFFLTTANFCGSKRLRKLVYQIQKKMLSKISDGLIITTSNGFKIYFDRPDDKGVESWLFFTGDYERGTQHILKSILNEGDSFIDVGANIGLITILASKKVGKEGKVYSFEPEKDTAKILGKNLKLNNIHNVSVFKFGLSDQDEKRDIYIDEEKGRGGNSLIKREEGQKKERVILKTLDGFMGGKITDPIKLIKIDVEGWEINVLRGAQNILKGNKQPILCLEYSQELTSNNTDDVYEYLKKYGYRFFKLDKGKEIPSKMVPINTKNDLPAHDNIFAFPKSYIYLAEELNR